MIKDMYIRVWKVLVRKPFRLWGISLLGVLLTSMGASLALIPLLAIAIALLLELGMARIFLRGYRGEENHAENLFDGFRDGVGRKLGGAAWAELFKFLWGLIPVVGFVFAAIRAYEYAFVPYILMERPEVSALEARNVSKEETNGWKGLMFAADVCLGVMVLLAFLVLCVLNIIPVIGILFRLLTVVYVLACIAFLPLCYGLLHAAFYEEIHNGNLAAKAAAQANAVNARYNGASYCPNCGSPLDPGARFCSNCGTPVSALAPEPEAAPETTKTLVATEPPEEEQE
jgi:uncharacterized membrane protein